jgi:hypothetical protein
MPKGLNGALHTYSIAPKAQVNIDSLTKLKNSAKGATGAPFCQKSAQIDSKNASSLADGASNNKNKIDAHPTGHGNARFGPTQQPTNNIAA